MTRHFIRPAHLLTAVASTLFIIVDILFAIDIFKKKTELSLPTTIWCRYLTVFGIFLVFLYPLIGMAVDHRYPKTRMPMAPDPLTVFAIALVTAAKPKVDRKVYMFLLP